MHEYHTNSQKYDAQRWATAFVDAGINVLQLWPMDAAGRCTCKPKGCGNAGKHPVYKAANRTDFPKEPNRFAVLLDQGEFDSGYGVLLDQSGILVVDVDARNGGIESFERLANRFPEIRGAGFIVTTGSGGGSRHLYFRIPEGIKLRDKLDGFGGIDFKSSGFVVGPGSRHKSGGVYTAALGDLGDIEEAPAALVAALQQPKSAPAPSSIPLGTVDIEIVAEALRDLPADDRKTWLNVGATLQAEYGEDGRDLWERWSATAHNYDPKNMDVTWWSLANKASGLEGLFELCKVYRESAELDAPLRAETDRIVPLESAPIMVQDACADYPTPSIFKWLPDEDGGNGGGSVVIRMTDAKGKAHGYHVVGGDWRERPALNYDWVRLPGSGTPLIASDLPAGLSAWRTTGQAVWVVGGFMRPAAVEELREIAA